MDKITKDDFVLIKNTPQATQGRQTGHRNSAPKNPHENEKHLYLTIKTEKARQEAGKQKEIIKK